MSIRRIGLVAILAVVLVCIGFAFAANRPRRPAPSTGVVETDPTSAPAARQPTAVPRGYMSRAFLGDDWPLTVDEGTIVCDRNAILFRDSTDRLYAVNGAAISQAASKGWRDIHEIDIDTGNGTIKSLQPLLDVGLALCR